MQIHNGHTLFLGASFPGIFFENIFRISGLNSFQQSEISRPFSRFIIDFDVISFPGLRQSIKSDSFIFLFLQCVSDSKNILLPKSILCFGVWTLAFHSIFVLVFSRGIQLLCFTYVVLVT